MLHLFFAFKYKYNMIEYFKKTLNISNKSRIGEVITPIDFFTYLG